MGTMLEVVIDSLRVSLTNQQRVVVLHEKNSENYLPIWIGPYEAEAITIALQEVEVSRPLTHDLLKNSFTKLHAHLLRIEISALKDDVFYAHILAETQGEMVLIDSRPSDAIALAVRAHIPIFVDSEVMSKAGITPDKEISAEHEAAEDSTPEEKPAAGAGGENRLSVFEDFLKGLDIDDTKPEDEDPDDKPAEE
jgi:bifunctional DNase/RNase